MNVLAKSAMHRNNKGTGQFSKTLNLKDSILSTARKPEKYKLGITCTELKNVLYLENKP